MARKKKVTLAHIAQELGLTIQTVSKALRGLPGMSEETRQQVWEAVRRLQYVTKEQVQALAAERVERYPTVRRRFILLLTEAAMNYNRLLMQGLRERFLELGHTVEIVVLPQLVTELEFRRWVEKSGLLYSDGLFIGPKIGRAAVEEWLMGLGIPKIMLGFPAPESGVDSVIWDVEEAIHQAVRHLVKLGHRRILYVGDTRSQRGFALRWYAFQAAMEEHGIGVRPEEHCTGQGFNGILHQREFADRYEMVKPSAVLCGIDEDVLPIYETIVRRYGPVPASCSLVGILNEQTDRLPVLSRPLLRIKDTGYRAADRLLWRIANPLLPVEHIRIKGEWYPGATAVEQ